MSTVVKAKLWVRRRAKGEVVLSAEAPREPEWRPTGEELTRALAWHFLGLLDEGVVADQAELARRFRVSRARVSQVVGSVHGPTGLRPQTCAPTPDF